MFSATCPLKIKGDYFAFFHQKAGGFMTNYLQLILGAEYFNNNDDKIICSKNKSLNVAEAHELYESLKYYTYEEIQDIAFNMYQRDITPIELHWQSKEEFIEIFRIFYKISHHFEGYQFAHIVAHSKIPFSIDFNRKQREILVDKEQYIFQSRCILHFFQSLPEFFEYEVTLISLGYPCEHQKIA